MRIKVAGARPGQGGGGSAPFAEMSMTRLMLIVFSMASTTLMGVLIVAALVAGYDTLRPILYAALIGFVVAIPVSWQVAKAIS